MTRVDAGGKGWRLLATKKMLGTSRFGEGEKSLICDPGFELRLGGREREKQTKGNCRKGYRCRAEKRNTETTAYRVLAEYEHMRRQLPKTLL